MKKYNIVLIGAGNVAWHLGHALQQAGHNILQVFSRTRTSAEALAVDLEVDPVNEYENITKDGDLYIIAVPDYAIDDVILSGLKLDGKIVVHTSGTVPMLGLEHISDKRGIFYPLQTFTKNHAVDLSKVPILIEASDRKVRSLLEEVAQSISNRVEYLDSEKRRALHVAAVFSNNFTNYLFSISEGILENEELSFDLIVPLLRETVKKLERKSPSDVQTGPATRNDLKTIDDHLDYLKDYPEFKEIYLVLTEGLLSTYANKAENKDDL